MKFMGESLESILESMVLGEIIHFIFFFRQNLPLNLELGKSPRPTCLWPPSALECQAYTHKPGFYMGAQGSELKSLGW